ncbi:PREDICTED: pentatricopeptide repeat-containing protein At4g14170 [Camelina sativa]|uniref:Pentatricopeptide repeat-containing protein At4g14170 n=1 Tax=Camelina sativa TaxID=90675 RepID=A0ABM0V372_CAMSA|nr:PREDICTED: pentatricopeptide repeat-containing protein At4g14170 [Camelina sativa]
MHLASSSSCYSRTAKNLLVMFLKSRAFSVTTTQNPPDLFSLLHHSPNAKHLRHLHAHLLRTSTYSDVVLSSKLVLAYSKLNRLFLPTSLSVFWHMPCRNIFSWNIIIGEFSRSGFASISIGLFLRMWRESSVRPDDFTLPLVLRACSASREAKLGDLVHVLCLKLGFNASLFVSSALVIMYVDMGQILHARKLFDDMPVRDSVLYTAMFGGYVQQGEAILGLVVFREMMYSGFALDSVVMVSLLTACGQLGALKHGKSVHGWSIRRCSCFGLNLGNAITDMYVKCSNLDYAYGVFVKMPNRDVISWSSLILGYGLDGNVVMAIKLFEEMLKERIEPNAVTFLGVLSACAHGGLVEKSWLYLRLMQEYKIVPELKHYASVADCMSRAGLLEEAEKFLEDMPVEPDEAVMGAVLSGCKVHGNVEVGERVAKKLIQLEPGKAGYYVTLAGLYSATGRFDEAESLREWMKEKQISKVPGCSSI